MNKDKSYPIANGSFIQADMVYIWDDEMWIKELRYLKEADMHYVVVMGTSLTEGDTTKTIYPTKIPGGIMEYDVLGRLLRNAEKADMKVFLGINYNGEWWRKYGNDPAWLYAQMDRANLIADELFDLYHFKYPNAFYGWYWAYEVDNLNFRTKEQLKVLANAININLRHFTEKNERLPVLLSPFMNSNFSTPEQYAKVWEYVLKNTELGSGDILCPQDSVGSGGLNVEELQKWFSALKKAANTKPGLLFWANNETFDQSDWSSATLDRFIKQLQFTDPYVTNHITFAYSHYYSPNNIHYGFHKTYLGYVNTGNLGKFSPTAPKNLKLKVIDKNQVSLNWEESGDNIGIYGYEIYRNGNVIHTYKRQRFYGGAEEDISTEYVDSIELKGIRKKYVYKVRTFDFTGNFSEFSEEAEIIAGESLWYTLK